MDAKFIIKSFKSYHPSMWRVIIFLKKWEKIGKLGNNGKKLGKWTKSEKNVNYGKIWLKFKSLSILPFFPYLT